MDLNAFRPQQTFSPIPKGTVARVRLKIKPGGHNDPSQGWTGGFATCRSTKGTVYLKCEFIIQDPPYKNRKIWNIIGLYSPTNPQWGEDGHAFLRGICNSAYGFGDTDSSAEAAAIRQKDLGQLNGMEFIARIDKEENKLTGQQKNVIKFAVTKGHKDYPDGYPEGMQGIPHGHSSPTAASSPYAPTSWG